MDMRTVNQSNQKLLEKFRAAYDQAKTWKEGDEIVAWFTTDEMKEIIVHLEFIEALMGLDMRQKFYLALFRGRVRY